MAMRLDDEERGLTQGAATNSGVLDEAFEERAEMHEAEGAPLVWSEAKKTWITTQEAELDGEETLQASSSSGDSPPGSQNPLPSSGAPGKKPVRAISALSDGEPIYVAFEDDDPDNPFEWPRKKKWIITGIGAWLTTLGMCPPTFSFKCEKVESTAHPLHDRRSCCYFLQSLSLDLVLWQARPACKRNLDCRISWPLLPFHSTR